MFPVRKAAMALVLLTLLSFAPAVRADEVDDAKQVVASVVSDALSSFAGTQLPPAERDAKLRSLVAQYGDLDLFGQDILGHYWTKATPEQRQRFQKLMMDYVLGSWGNQLSDLPADQKIDITASDTLPNGRIVLHALASHTGDVSVMDWTFAKTPDGKLVVADVMLEGVSIIQTMRGDFTAIILANGGRMDALLDALQQKISSYKTN